MKISNTVDVELKRFYAIIASAYAECAVIKAKHHEPGEADRFVEATEKWLRKAGAQATRNYFTVRA